MVEPIPIKVELKDLLAKLVRREHLSDDEATFAIQLIASEASTQNPVGVGVLLALLAAKGESAGEVAAIAKYVRAQSIKVKAEVSERKALWLLIACWHCVYAVVGC